MIKGVFNAADLFTAEQNLNELCSDNNVMNGKCPSDCFYKRITYFLDKENDNQNDESITNIYCSQTCELAVEENTNSISPWTSKETSCIPGNSSTANAAVFDCNSNPELCLTCTKSDSSSVTEVLPYFPTNIRRIKSIHGYNGCT